MTAPQCGPWVALVCPHQGTERLAPSLPSRLVLWKVLVVPLISDPMLRSNPVWSGQLSVVYVEP